MTTVSRSDKIKTKKKETQVLMPDVPSKKRTVSRALKAPNHFNESKSISNEKQPVGKNKLENATTNKGKSGRTGTQISSDRSKITGNSETNKSGVQSVSTAASKGTHVLSRVKNLSKSTAVSETSDKTSYFTIGNRSFIQKKNAVLDTPHNVTVSSPPSKRKNDPNHMASKSVQKVDASKLVRKGSRTLAPNEIVILKRASDKMRNEEAIRKESWQVDRNLSAIKRQPIAFEIKFHKNDKEGRHLYDTKNFDVERKQRGDEEIVYSDDFESYESDFETGSSTNSLPISSTPSDENHQVSEEDANQEDSLNQITSDDSVGDEDDTDVTEKPVLGIQVDKESKMDSGNYDTSLSKINPTKSSDPAFKSFKSAADNWEATSLEVSEQMDSGISACTTLMPFAGGKTNFEVIYGGYRNFYEKPLIGSRGCQLKRKIQFDVLSFSLIELKPISYEVFMQTFGKINTNQNFTQTDDNERHVEQQTEVHATRSFWTQHPPQLVLETSKHGDTNEICKQLFCGEGIEKKRNQKSYCELEQNLNAMKQLRSNTSNPEYQSLQKRPTNYQLLHSFLLRSSFFVDQILGSSKLQSLNTDISLLTKPAHVHDQVLKRVCERSFSVETNFLNTLRVIKIFSNNKFNLLITVHESLPDSNVYSSDFTNLLMVWSTSACNKPMRLLTTWSEVSKIEIPNESSDIVVAALRDASIALWDLRETHSFCSKLDGYLTHFAATQSVVPSYIVEKGILKFEVDLGACLDVKSFKTPAGNNPLQLTFPKTQFASLHESGIVTVWTLVQTSESTFNLVQVEQCEKIHCSRKFAQMFDSISPWARVKLTQSSIVNIREYLETKSDYSKARFEKTKDLFQKNIYSDEYLRELGETPEVGRHGIRFTSLECGSENLFICTNRNFVLMCTKTLKMDKLKRIFIDDSQLLFPTALKLLDNERFLAVGLCNGVVMILNCQSDKVAKSHKELTKKYDFSKISDCERNPILHNSLTSKSCAIQNILLNAQKTCENFDSKQDDRPSTEASVALIGSNRKSFELKIIDQQVIMSGSALRKNLIQHLELSSEGWYLFALANGHVRAYDFYLEQEIPNEESPEPGLITDLATNRSGCKDNNLMILRSNADVEVIILKQ